MQQHDDTRRTDEWHAKAARLVEILSFYAIGLAIGALLDHLAGAMAGWR